MVFPRRNPPLPHGPFPFDSPVQVLPNLTTRLPLSPYCNPLSAPLRQPRCFPRQNVPVLSLFCKDGFQRQYRHLLWPQANSRVLLFPHILTQGRLRCTQHTILCTALQVLFPARTRADPSRGFCRRRTIPGLHGSRVGCPMPLERARDP